MRCSVNSNQITNNSKESISIWFRVKIQTSLVRKQNKTKKQTQATGGGTVLGAGQDGLLSRSLTEPLVDWLIIQLWLKTWVKLSLDKNTNKNDYSRITILTEQDHSLWPVCVCYIRLTVLFASTWWYRNRPRPEQNIIADVILISGNEVENHFGKICWERTLQNYKGSFTEAFSHKSLEKSFLTW